FCRSTAAAAIVCSCMITITWFCPFYHQRAGEKHARLISGALFWVPLGATLLHGFSPWAAARPQASPVESAGDIACANALITRQEGMLRREAGPSPRGRNSE